ncbi:MAG TPA: hypothetical protein DGT23_14725 [Micromonosporaceae bacterium]|nr:hypothetical protein [Micromonosporaceae bacterium]
MPRNDDDFVTVEELPELLRSFGVLPGQQRTVPASGARSVLSAFERHGTHNQKDHGRRKGFGFDAPATDVAQVHDRLLKGEKVRADPSIMDDLMERIKESGELFNFARLNVSGKGNGNLFQRHLRDRPRETMPQLPTETGADMDQFMDFLKAKGVGFEFGTIDPRKLVASQSELSGPKVAKLYGFMREDGWKPGGTMIISRDGAVIDGHHRWAGAAAASIARGGTMEVTVMKIDADLDDILGTDENPDGIVMDFAKFESLDTDREA